ncbi:MAG: hypothetical protein GX654_16970 [Desulfatiglans sp.]|jgi:hypothetical protein|nr:hypothetical protein [Desulfatiglans sp.]
MSDKKIRIVIFTGLIILLLTGFSCASTKVNLLNNKSVKLEKVSDQGVRIMKVFVHKENDEMQISGIVKNTSFVPVTSGHVDIAVISPEGVILQKISANYLPGTLSNRKRHHQGSRFSADLQSVPPAGSTVRIAFHKTPFITGRTFICDENRAI